MKRPLTALEKALLVERGEAKFQPYLIIPACVANCRCPGCFQQALDRLLESSQGYVTELAS